MSAELGSIVVLNSQKTSDHEIGLFEEGIDGNQRGNDTSPGEVDSLPNWFFNISSLYLAIVFISSVILNGIVIVTFLRSKKLFGSSFNVIIFNLTLNELMASLFGVSVDLYSSMSYGWKHSPLACHITGFGHTLAGMTSVFTLTALAICRYYIVDLSGEKRRSNRSKKRCTLRRVLTSSCSTSNQNGHLRNQGKAKVNKKAFKIIGIIWICSIILSVPPLLGWGEYVPDKSRINCGPNWSERADLSFTIFMFAFGFFIPSMIIIPANVGVLFRIKQATASKQDTKLRSKAQKREQAVLIMLLMMTMAFFICWSPYAIVSLLATFGIQLATYIHALPVLFAKSSVVINPLLYIYGNKEFLNEFKCQLKSKQSGEQTTQSASGQQSIPLQLRSINRRSIMSFSPPTSARANSNQTHFYNFNEIEVVAEGERTHGGEDVVIVISGEPMERAEMV